MRLNSPSQRTAFPWQIPGPTNVPDRILRAMDYPRSITADQSSMHWPGRVLRSVRPGLPDQAAGDRLSGVGHGRLGGGVGQHAVRPATWC